MACTGTYLGNCCGPAPVPMTISAQAAAAGFIAADWVSPYQLYGYAEYGVTWDYTLFGERYSGQRTSIGWFDEDGTGPFYSEGGDAYDEELDAFIFTYTSYEFIGETEIQLKWWLPTGTPAGCSGDLVASAFYRVSDPRKMAHEIAQERVNTFDPAGPAIPGVVVELGRFANALTSSSKIPNNSRRNVVCQHRAISSGFNLDWQRTTGQARRVIVTPDTTRKLRLKPYDKTFGNVTTLGPCSSLNLDTGLDISAPYLTPGMAESGIELSVHLKTAGDPCAL